MSEMPAQRFDRAWDGVALRSTYDQSIVAKRDQIADAARDGQWTQLFALLGHGSDVNRTRIGGTEGFAPLHQVAWHGAPVDVARRLIDLGAWRTLRTAAGQTPLDIARQRGHEHLADVLRPVVRHPLAEEVLRGLEEYSAMLIRGGKSADLVVEQQLKLPQIEPITELPEPKLHFRVPGQYGGHDLELRGDELWVTDSSRVGGWTRIHRVTRYGIHFVKETQDVPGLPTIVRSGEPGR